MREMRIDATMARRLHVAVITARHELRQQAEAFVHQTYRQRFGANVRHAPNTLLAMVDDSGTIHCVAGLRRAAEGFLSQHYLGAPLVEVIGALDGQPMHPEEIVEISGLASRSPLCSLQFIGVIVRFCTQQGYRWSVFTVTRRLAVLLKRKGLPLVELAAADARRMPDAQCWGRYYEAEPRVCAISRAHVTDFLNRVKILALPEEGRA